MTWQVEIAQWLERAKMTHAEAAQLLGVRTGTISDWSRGEATPHKRQMERYREMMASALPDAVARPRNVPAEALTQSLSVATLQTGAALPTFDTEAERRAATLALLYLAQTLGPQLVKTVNDAVATLLGPIAPASSAPETLTPESSSRAARTAGRARQRQVAAPAKKAIGQ